MDDLLSLHGHRALVTGASSGLGRHFAMTLARAGAEVVLAARRLDALEDVAAAIRATGGTAHPVVMDVTDERQVEAGFAQGASALGPIDIVINNSGIAIAARVSEMSSEDWDQVVATNLRGAFLVARRAARDMTDAGAGGAIVNIASILGTRVLAGLGAYGATKAGLIQLTRTMALELARHRIRVNAIAPGYILTDMNRDFFSSPPGEKLVARIPQRRLGDPSDLDGPLLLLTSPRASGYMTGSVITVDGGHLQSSL